jgi:hypothetical protein
MLECMKHLVGLHILSLVVLAGFLAGCEEPRDIGKDFQNEDPKIRISAIRRAGREKIESSMPYLVDRLSDDEDEVRMFAILALKEITGMSHGYRYYHEVTLRNEAIEKWRKWLADRKAGSTASQPVRERKTG